MGQIQLPKDISFLDYEAWARGTRDGQLYQQDIDRSVRAGLQVSHQPPEQQIRDWKKSRDVYRETRMDGDLDWSQRYNQAQWDMLPASKKIRPLAAQYPADPAGAGVRKLLNAAVPASMAGTRWARQPDGSYLPAKAQAKAPVTAEDAYYGPPPPFIAARGDVLAKVPNPAYGEMYGLEWDGKKWVKKNPNADLEREAMELELEKRRRDMSGAGSGIREWLAKRLGR